MSALKLSIVSAAIALVATVSLPVYATVPGNNGTLKVHEQGTPRGSENNDPKVCTFNFEGYGFDKGQDGIIVITKQGGGNDRSEVKHVSMPAAVEADQHGTFTETAYVKLADGHYKTTVYGKDNKGEYKVDLKAKSKVIKVVCDAEKAVDNNGQGGDKTTSTNNGGHVLSDQATDTTSQASGGKGGGALPETLPSTGGSPLQALFNTLFAGAGVYSAALFRSRNS